MVPFRRLEELELHLLTSVGTAAVFSGCDQELAVAFAKFVLFDSQHAKLTDSYDSLVLLKLCCMVNVAEYRANNRSIIDFAEKEQLSILEELHNLIWHNSLDVVYIHTAFPTNIGIVDDGAYFLNNYWTLAICDCTDCDLWNQRLLQ